MSTQQTSNTAKTVNWLTIIGGSLAIILAIGYIALLAVNRPVPSTYVVVLVAAVTHFLGVALPNGLNTTAATTLQSVLESVLGAFTSLSTSTVMTPVASGAHTTVETTPSLTQPATSASVPSTTAQTVAPTPTDL